MLEQAKQPVLVQAFRSLASARILIAGIAHPFRPKDCADFDGSGSFEPSSILVAH